MLKMFKSPDYNFIFNTNSGFFARWGKTMDDDPEFSPVGNEILDIEVTDICKGPGGIPCKFCYKSNTPNNTSNMSFGMFKNIIDKMPSTLTQAALGVDAQCESNPDIWKMMEYSRSKGIIPNITVADITVQTARLLSNYCGAVSVSRYENKDYCYNSIQKLINCGMKQVNIHILLSTESLNQVYETINDYISKDYRLKNLNAIVLLSLKKKGRGKEFTPVSQLQFKNVVDYALSNNVPIGFDSCSYHKFVDSITDRKDFDALKMCSEPCESSCFSAYINSKGYYFPCSFSEGVDEWTNGIDVTQCNDFLNDIWLNEKNVKFRTALINNNRKCPIYSI